MSLQKLVETQILNHVLHFIVLVRSCLDPGSVLFSKPNLKRIEIVQNKALRICIGAMQSTPIKPLQVKANELLLRVYREFLTNKYIQRLISTNQNYIFRKYLRLFKGFYI